MKEIVLCMVLFWLIWGWMQQLFDGPGLGAKEVPTPLGIGASRRSLRANPSHVRETESAEDLKNRIVEAVVHQASLDALRVAVERRGSEVTLGGTVLSQWEEDLAVQVAGNTPGVGSVVDRISLRRSE